MENTQNQQKIAQGPFSASSLLSSEAREIAARIGMSPEVYAAKVERIAGHFARGESTEAIREYQGIVEAYGYMTLADGIYAEARRAAQDAI